MPAQVRALQSLAGKHSRQGKLFFGCRHYWTSVYYLRLAHRLGFDKIGRSW